MHVIKITLYANFNLNTQRPWLHVKVKGSNRVCCEVHKWIFCKRWQMGENVIISNTESYMWSFDWHIYIWSILKVRVKIIQFSLWISRKQWKINKKLLLPTNKKSHMVFWLVYLDVTFFYSEGQHDHRNGVLQKILTLFNMYDLELAVVVFRQICKTSPIAMGLSISVSVCVCVLKSSHLSENQKCKKNDVCWFWQLPSNGVIVKIALHYVDLLFRGKKLKKNISEIVIASAKMCGRHL